MTMKRSIVRWLHGVLAAFLFSNLWLVGAPPTQVAAAVPAQNRQPLTPVQAKALLEAPRVTDTLPLNGSTSVNRDIFIAANVYIPNGGLDPQTLTANSVKLIRVIDNFEIVARLTTSAAGDVIILNPNEYLDPFTQYRFRVNVGVATNNLLRDIAGEPFEPYESVFTTGSAGGPSATGNIRFNKVATGITMPNDEGYTSLAIGPDGKLYAATVKGQIVRYTINADGTLNTANSLAIQTVRTYTGTTQDRMIIGLVFDPASTVANPIVWITHSPYALSGGPDWSGKLTRLSGANLTVAQDYLIGMPRSSRDHLSNSLVFGPDGALYMTVGSNSAMGYIDSGWNLRPEHKLGAAVLRIDQNGLGTLPLNVQTEDGGTYDPFAANAPVTIYASGVRNAYDLIWHTNGQLYTATNGSAAGGNTPPSPGNLSNYAPCQNRIDVATNGAYVGPDVPKLSSSSSTRIPDQSDFMYRITPGGYYGHPNPQRCEWVLNGGNPSSGIDPAEVAPGGSNVGYPVGTQSDRNYRGFSWDFGLHKSPNGTIEYKSNTFNGALKGKLIVTRYSGSKDLVVLTIGANKEIISEQGGLPGMKDFSGPLDVIENTANGHLYVSDYLAEKLYLLTPDIQPEPRIDIKPARRVFNLARPTAGSLDSTTQTFVISNTGQANLSVTGVQLIGPEAGSFVITNLPSFPRTLVPSATLSLNVVMRANAATTLGTKGAIIQIQSNDPINPKIDGALRGLVYANGTEPSLQWILDTYEFPMTVGDDDPTTTTIHSTNGTSLVLGQEVLADFFTRATTSPITLEPLAAFGPSGQAGTATTLGWYPVKSAGANRTSIFSVPNSSAQSLNPNVTGSLTFEPGYEFFDFYTQWPALANRVVYGQDSLNSFDVTNPHHMRVYPLKTTNDSTVTNAYVIVFEEATTGLEYQDLVFIVRNVRPVRLPEHEHASSNQFPKRLDRSACWLHARLGSSVRQSQ